ARNMATEDFTRLRDVIEAVADGRLKAKTNVAGLIVTFVQNPSYDIPAAAAAVTTLGRSDMEDRYRIWAKEQQRRMLTQRPDIDVDQIRRDVVASCKAGN